MTSAPGRVPAGVPTGGQFAASTRAEADVSLYPDGTARPYALLAEPEVSESRGTTITNRVAAPITEQDGIFAYGGSCSPDPYSDRICEGGYGVVPNRRFRFFGGPSARDGMDLMRVKGMARSHAEGWDRIALAEGRWAARYDRRPSEQRLVDIGEQRAARIAALAERLAAADALDTAIEARKALPTVGVRPSTRRAIRDLESAIEAAWVTYCERYPHAEHDNAKP